jgi:hypothetical protein
VQGSIELFEKFYDKVHFEILDAFPSEGEDEEFDAVAEELLIQIFGAMVNICFDGHSKTWSVQDAIDNIKPSVDGYRASRVKNASPEYAKRLETAFE